MCGNAGPGRRWGVPAAVWPPHVPPVRGEVRCILFPGHHAVEPAHVSHPRLGLKYTQPKTRDPDP